MVTSAPGDALFNAEALKLLVQVAAANDHVHEAEREFLRKLASTWKIPGTLTELFAALDERRPLPQPNLSLLRTQAERVLRAAQALVAIDGDVDEEEHAMLSEVKTLLAL